MKDRCVLAINTGSSSLKMDVFAGSELRIASLAAERIGLPRAEISFRCGEESRTLQKKLPSHIAALELAVRELRERGILEKVAAVGHRVVHGGGRFVQPQRITARVNHRLRELTAIDPDHMPQALAAISAVEKFFPRIPQFACFDTAFHATLPMAAQIYGLPRKFRALGVRRYGFHGISCESIVHQLHRILPREAKGRLIIAHLGNGCSMTAVRNGASIETSMGFSPTGGLVMSSRCGDLDPSVVLFLAKHESLKPEQITKILNKQSGLLGVSGSSADMRDLLQRERRDPRAKQAIDLFCHQARKFMGAWMAVLGGLDTLVFTGGMGEHSSAIRERICGELQPFGIELDRARNDRNAAIISSRAVKVTVRVMQTDENQIIAHQVMQLIAKE